MLPDGKVTIERFIIEEAYCCTGTLASGWLLDSQLTRDTVSGDDDGGLRIVDHPPRGRSDLDVERSKSRFSAEDDDAAAKRGDLLEIQ